MIKIINLQKKFIKKGRENFELNIPILNIEENEIIYFVGPNASGKSTLLNLIQGSIEKDSGSVLLKICEKSKEIDLLKFDPYKRSKYLGFVPQDSDDALVNEMNIIEHILIGLNKKNNIPWFFPKQRNKNKVIAILKEYSLNFENRLYEAVGNLSSGERQILAFCLATLNKPSILLLDEFTASLDPEMAHKVLNIVINVIRSNKFSALVVTHRQQEAIDYADRIIVLHKGKPYVSLNKKDQNFSITYLNNLFKELYNVEQGISIE